jgi:hypothetical protein
MAKKQIRTHDFLHGLWLFVESHIEDMITYYLRQGTRVKLDEDDEFSLEGSEGSVVINQITLRKGVPYVVGYLQSDGEDYSCAASALCSLDKLHALKLLEKQYNFLRS